MRSIWALLVLASLTGPLMANSESKVYGFVEKATLVDKNLTLSAKLDTGAKSASLHAINISEIQVKGTPYLRFTVPTKEKDYLFECPYVGKVKIKVRAHENKIGTLANQPIKRPVVMLPIQLGNKIRTIRVNLTNRKRFIYPILLGRDAIIAFNGAVDPALTFTLKSQSSKKNEKQ